MSDTLASLRADYDALVARGLSLDLTRGKPSKDQLDLANPLLGLDLGSDHTDRAGTDLRNYGGTDGVVELREIFSDLLGIPVPQLLAGGNASLTTMHDVVVHALLHGVPGSSGAWVGQDVAFLCPSPGYDRHFAITEALGIRMIPVAPLADGSLDLEAIETHLADPAVRGMWLVPLYANPTGAIVDEQTARALASMTAAAADFRIFWDNAYAVHHLTDEEFEPIDILGLAAEAGHPDRFFVFASTSKMTQAGAGVAFFGSSPANIAWYRTHSAVQTIGPDKLNQWRHARFFGDASGLRAHMRRHRNLLAPKFALVDRMLTDGLSGHATWTTPKGGYFVTLWAPEGTASRAVQLAKEAGVALTPAGAAFPYGTDPQDSVIRIAPSMPSISDLEAALEALVLCVLLAEAEKSA
ncbi:aminotransferase class I/II-fold pyridoxal phosphate-dependent enzyme [Homoserinibacter sp. GY 40078]|uniref:aminotransferase class I/II-fold pyridoxal phosphate-dependent enzyme n=1 Tax=Homoserinibacter sp. GY 40078 TaxID=2603275 RepID=UPI0011CB6A76|nr:aminotransferase class I/II-fold pyridoxal phosphate-dependent enzyme [Homoserinibacter sp. GY 40078]TXK17624.1 aminotransferase class I/II-fold pyridoxal phosphate-dependent enzyme [Homoserinibacter sp. GY 40078]